MIYGYKWFKSYFKMICKKYCSLYGVLKMSKIRFTCTRLTNTGKKGIITPDANGYYDMVIGGLNMYNSAGMKYTAVKEVIDLFQNKSSSFRRKVERGALRGEVGHPKFLPGMSKDAFIDRIMTIDEKNVCCHFQEVYLDFENFKNEDGTAIIAIKGLVKPSGVQGEFLKQQLENPKENVCFSIRSFTEDYYEKGTLCRDIKNIITFDYVNEPGIHIAEKYKNPALEDMSSVMLSRTDFDKNIQRQVVGIGKESVSMDIKELFTSFGWTDKNKKLPAHSKW